MAINPHHWDWDKAPHPGGPMSLDEYLELDRLSPYNKYEYVDGEALMMAGGTRAHDRISRNVAYAIDIHFASGTTCGVSGSDLKVRVPFQQNKQKKTEFVYPDVTLSCNLSDLRPDATVVEMPRLVVEVLSRGTEAKDRGAKLKAYKANPYIYEILLVEQYAPHVEVWQRSHAENAQWQLSTYDAGEIIRLEELDIELAVDDFYRGIDFDAFRMLP
jgi:Uma2 family endonuclease